MADETMFARLCQALLDDVRRQTREAPPDGGGLSWSEDNCAPAGLVQLEGVLDFHAIIRVLLVELRDIRGLEPHKAMAAHLPVYDDEPGVLSTVWCAGVDAILAEGDANG